MDSPASTLLSVAIVLGAIALVMVVSAVLERRHARRIARSPHVEHVIDSLVALAAVARDRAVAAARAVDRPSDAPEVESTSETVSAEFVRRLVDPSIPPVDRAYPWRSSSHAVLPFDVLGYDGSKVWSREESDGLVALFHLGTDIASLADEMGVDPRVLVEELARRLYGAIDPVVDPSRPRAGTPWTDADRAAVGFVVRSNSRLPDAARQLGRDQLDLVGQLIREGHVPARVGTVR